MPFYPICFFFKVNFSKNKQSDFVINADLGIFRSLFAPLRHSRPRLNHAHLPHCFFFKVNFSKNKQGDFMKNADLGIFRSFAGSWTVLFVQTDRIFFAEDTFSVPFCVYVISLKRRKRYGRPGLTWTQDVIAP